MKRKFAILLAGIMALSMMSINAMADSSITVPIKMDKAVTNTVTGYIAEVEYNPDALEPVLSEPDVLGEDCYAENATGVGYLTADKVEDGKLVVGWADAVQYELTDNNILSNIKFSIFENAVADIRNDDGDYTNINVKIYQIAKYPDVMYDGDYTYSETYQIKSGNSIVVDDDVESGGSVVPDDVTSESAVEVD